MTVNVLTAEDAVAIYERTQDGESNILIALDFEVTPQTVSAIKLGQNWGHATGQVRIRAPKQQLSVEDVLAIDKALTAGGKPIPLAREFNVAVQTIRNIQTGRNWTQVTGRTNTRKKY
jgi:hypothetical protein